MTATAQRLPDRTAAEVNAHFESLRTDAVDRLDKLLTALADGMPLADADVDVDELLEKAQLTRDWFTQTLSEMKTRPKLAAKAQQVSALKERKATNVKARTELQSKCDRAVDQAVAAAMQPFYEPLSSLETEGDGIDDELKDAEQAEKQLIGMAPDWLRSEKGQTARELNRLKDEAERKLQPEMGAAHWYNGAWHPPQNIHGACSIEARERFDAFMLARAADDERRAALQPRIAALQERLRRLRKLSLQAQPMPGDIARIDRELAEQVADIDQESADHKGDA